MKIAYNPTGGSALSKSQIDSLKNDIIFDLSGMAVYARGIPVGKVYLPFEKSTSSTTEGYNGLVPFPDYNGNSKTRFLREDGTWVVPTNTNNYRPISVNGASILGNNNTALNLVAGTNITLNPKKDSNNKYTGEVTITASNPAWNNITGKPTTLAGYGIKDAFTWKRNITSTTTDDNALWGEIGIQTYVGVLPDGLTGQYYYGVLASFNNNKDSSSQFQLYASDYRGDNTTNRRHIAWRTGHGANKGTWQRLANIDTKNIFTESQTFQKQIKSTIATGTAPFSVASTTLVTNLNADMLDGKHLNDILNSNAASSTKLETSRTIWGLSFDGTQNVQGALSGATTITTSGNITTGNSTTTSSLSHTVENNNGKIGIYAATRRGLYDYTIGNWLINTDGTNTRLMIGNIGIGTDSPTQKLDVNGNVRIYSTNLNEFIIHRHSTTSGAYVTYKNDNGTLGILGLNNDTKEIYLYKGDDKSTPYIIYHTGNLDKSTLGLGNVQNTAFYKSYLNINGNNYAFASTTNSSTSTTIYGPTTAGTSRQVLISSGGTPGWTNLSNITAGSVKGSYTSNGGKQNPNYFGVNKVGFLMMNTTVNNNSNYKDWIIMDCYAGSDIGGAVAFGVNRQSLGAYIMRSASERTSWTESAELLGTHNYNNYALSLSGGTLSGDLTLLNLYVNYMITSSKPSGALYNPWSIHMDNYLWIQSATANGTNAKGKIALSGKGAESLTELFLKADLTKIHNTILFNKLSVPTTSGGSTYGPGANGQVLKSNGSTVYWASDDNTTYTLPLAASGTRGGILIGYSESGKNYAVKLSSEKAYVYVPWTDTKVTLTNTTTNANYRVLLSNSANDNNTTEEARKSVHLTFNPQLLTLYTGNVEISGEIRTTTSGIHPKFRMWHDTTNDSLYILSGVNDGSSTSGTIHLSGINATDLSNLYLDAINTYVKGAMWVYGGLVSVNNNLIRLLPLSDANYIISTNANYNQPVKLIVCANDVLNIPEILLNTDNLYISGSVTASGEITAYSDRRLKSNIKPLENRGYIQPMTYIKDNKECIGFIAQDVLEKYPELVNDNSEYLSLNYLQYVAVLQALIIELEKRIKELENGTRKL